MNRLKWVKQDSALPLLLLGLAFHVSFIPIVFDCYFKSTVINGMKHFALDTEPPAKRLVLLVGDGLRADLLFNRNPFPQIPDSPNIVAPYLRSIVEERGAFGISHTRVPTESRPGHVAVIAGMYEDVSAVTKGWKINPVDFDSVFNQSSSTFSFGSPDILPMFARGAVPGRVHMWCYDESEEDFTKDATALDIWAYEKLESLLSNATANPNGLLFSSLHSPRVVFFLHLLGLDTTGHAFRPHSKEYMRNIQVVDSIVKKTETLLDDFYGHDGRTAFVFTADHGMSNIGNHGDGDPDSTRTPLIAWGAGIRGPLPDSNPSSHDDYSSKWDLSRYLRVDVNQADIASLMGYLIGANWAVNSVGVIPDVVLEDAGYLDASEEVRARVGLVNAQVILEQFRFKEQHKALKTLRFIPFKPLHLNEKSRSIDEAGEDHLTEIEELLLNGEWKEARKQARVLIDLSLEGLRYLQTYDRFLLRTIATFGYIGWSTYALCTVLDSKQLYRGVSDSWTLKIAMLCFAIATNVVLIRQKSPLTYYVYVFFPAFFWERVLQLSRRGLMQLRFAMIRDQIGKLVWSVLTVIALECMVMGYTHRSVWSVGFLILGFVWPLANWKSAQSLVTIQWILLCLIAAIFPALSVEKQEDIRLIALGAVVHFMIGVDAIRDLPSSTKGFKKLVFQLSLIILSGFVTISSTRSLKAKRGLSLVNQVTGWMILCASMITPFLNRKSVTNIDLRLTSYFLGFSPLFVILSIREEGLFYASFALLLRTWVKLEGMYTSPVVVKTVDGTRQLRFDDVRVALIFLFLVQVAFFGTGNIASISSFYLEPVYRLVPIFSPFLMATLLIIKIVAPYVILSAAFARLNHVLMLPPFSLFMIALSLTDVMTLTFFYRVRDQGSWLEIGQTISFFIISSMLLVWSGGICSAGQWLVAGSQQDQGQKQKEL